MAAVTVVTGWPLTRIGLPEPSKSWTVAPAEGVLSANFAVPDTVPPQVTLDGAVDPLELTWIDDQSWQVIVPLDAGPNALTLVATDLWGAVVGTDSIVVTSTGS